LFVAPCQERPEGGGEKNLAAELRWEMPLAAQYYLVFGFRELESEGKTLTNEKEGKRVDWTAPEKPWEQIPKSGDTVLN